MHVAKLAVLLPRQELGCGGDTTEKNPWLWKVIGARAHGKATSLEEEGGVTGRPA